MKAIKLLILLVAAVVFSGAAGATTEHLRSTGSTSGPAAGTQVEPSTAVQKGNPFIVGRQGVCWQSDVAAGVPGVASAVGTQAGPAAGGLSRSGE